MWRHSWLTKYWYDMADWQHILVYLALGLAVLLPVLLLLDLGRLFLGDQSRLKQLVAQ